MSLDAEQLFALLPAVYRTRDEQAGGPLQALFSVLAAQSALVEANIEQLYDDQFIETCSSWAIPYIGDLVGYNSIYEVASASGERRAEVGNTIAYRRRKGTLLALEQMASDASGRAAIAVEEFKRLITTESMRQVQPQHGATVDLRDGRALARLGTAFDTENRTIDVRRVAPSVSDATQPDPTPLEVELHGGGRFNIPDVAIHLWRWQSWQVQGALAFAVDERRFKFSPLGADMPLFSAPAERQAFSALATRGDVPEPIARDELLDYYAADGGPLLTAGGVPVAEGQIYPANLADRPGGSWCTVPAGMVAVDPELGRIQYAGDLAPPPALQVSYSYGFPAPIGGGPYDRSPALAGLDVSGAEFFAVVGTATTPTLESAVEAWNALAGSSGIIVVPDFQAFQVDVTGTAAAKLPAGSTLSILGGAPDLQGGPRDVIFNASQPTLSGDIEVVGLGGGQPGSLLLSGLRIAGQLTVSGAASTIQLADATLVPGLGLFADLEPTWPGEPSITLRAPGSTLVMNRTISGPLAVDESATTRVCGSIIDASSPLSVAYAGPDLAGAGGDLQVQDATLVGKVRTRTLTLASNTIFYARLGRRDPWPAAVWASRKQAGCVRFCVLPFASITPRRYNCLPPDAASEAALEPEFVTLRYGDPAYALLSADCPVAIWTGADNGSQLGAYLQIEETEAITNVKLRAPEYLPALLEGGVYIHPSRAQIVPTPAAPPYGYGWPPAGEEQLPGIGAALI